jgi:hypothetical protein
VIPLVRGDATDSPSHPRCRIRRSRQLLIAAAVLMCVYLLGSVTVVTLLVPGGVLGTGAEAQNRALAYLAHGGSVNSPNGLSIHPWAGPVLGLIYDVSTVGILCLAGASVMVALRQLVPTFLQRFGMELRWAHKLGLVFYSFMVINLIVTVYYRASVDSQRGAYATSVLVLITGAAFAAALQCRRDHGRGSLRGILFVVLTIGFLGVAVLVAATRPGGIVIASAFIAVLLITSILSRYLRSTELRFQGFEFQDGQSKLLWDTLCTIDTPILVPHRPGQHGIDKKDEEIRKQHHLGPELLVVFLQAEMGDASDFYQLPLVEIRQELGRFVIHVSRCVSVAHVIAAVALELSKVGPVPEVHFGWSDESPLSMNLNFLIFGQGNIPWLTRELIRRAEPKLERRPRIIIG